MYAKTVALIGGMASLANAHIKMSAPVPYGASSLNNSPLEADGSDFPCKQRGGVYDAEGASNVYELGSTDNELAFIGSAVHGGGSCQVSITYDAQPDANSVWKVIKTFEGGCPATGQDGNLPENANGEVPDKYSFDIPEDIPAGEGTIAWTWFNKVGNREMYMNCGPVTLTGDGGSEEAYDALPDMFTANIGNGCGTESSTDLEFPDPGEEVERLNGATDAFAAPTGGSCGASGTRPPPSGGDDDESEPPTVTAPPTPSGGAGDDDDEESSSGSPSLPGGIFLPEPTPSSEPELPEPTPETPETPETPDAGNGEEENQDEEDGSDDGSETPAPAPPTGEGSFEAGSACTTEGEWNCVGGSSFQRCASGSWSPVMELSGGTTCEPGQGANINMIVTRNGRTRPVRFRSA